MSGAIGSAAATSVTSCLAAASDRAEQTGSSAKATRGLLLAGATPGIPSTATRTLCLSIDACLHASDETGGGDGLGLEEDLSAVSGKQTLDSLSNVKRSEGEATRGDAGAGPGVGGGGAGE